MPMSERLRAAILTDGAYTTSDNLGRVFVETPSGDEDAQAMENDIMRALRVLAMLEGLSEEQIRHLAAETQSGRHAWGNMSSTSPVGDPPHWNAYAKAHETLASVLKEVGGAE